MQLPAPEAYSDWREWAHALSATVQRALAGLRADVDSIPPPPSDPPPPPTEFQNITIRDNLNRVILNPDGLWIWDSDGQLPIAPNIFEIDTRHLVDAAITTAKLRDFAVNTDKLANLAVNAAKLADLSVNQFKIVDGAVVNEKLANLSVDAAKLANSAVTAQKLANDAVTNEKILSGAVTTDKIAIAAIISNRIANDAVVREKLADFAVDAAKLADEAVTQFKLGNGAVVTTKIADAAIVTAKIGVAAVNTAQISDLAVTNAKVGLAAIGSANIIDAAVGSAAIGTAAVGTIHIANAAITSSLIGDLQVVTSKIDDLAVNNAKIANAAISSAKIQDLAVTNAKIANGAVDALKIGAAAINRTHIQDGEIVNAKIADVIQSNSWNPTTKQGWRINKAGQIEGNSITIYDEFGTPVFASGQLGELGAANLLLNSGFERGGLNVGWGLYSNDDASSPVTVTEVTGRLSARALRLNWSVPSTAPKGIYAGNLGGVDNSNKLQPNQVYVLSFYVRGDLAPSRMGLFWNTPPTQVQTISNPVMSTSWQRYVFRLQTGSSVDPNIFIGTSINLITGWFEIDDIQLEEGYYPTSYAPNVDEASRLALWSLITGAGKPQDNADVTALNIAAGIAGQGALATQNAVDLTTQVLGQLAASNVSGLGALALVSLLTGTNISTYIQSGAIGTALIADGAIIRAKIGDAQISTAKIEDAAVTRAKIIDGAINAAKIADAEITTAKIANGAITNAKIQDGEITTAKIQDGSITNAKIVSLVVDKLLSGNLDAVIEVANGRLQFTVGTSRLVIGNSFGSSDQFLLWFGPNVSISSMSESNATVYIKKNGQAYFGGLLAAGVRKNAARTTSLVALPEVEVGPFGSGGNPREITVQYYFVRVQSISDAYNVSGSGSYTLQLQRWDGTSWTTLTETTQEFSSTGTDGFGPTEPGFVQIEAGTSFVFTDNTTGSSFLYRARLTSRTLPTVLSTVIAETQHEQEVALTSIEQ